MQTKRVRIDRFLSKKLGINRRDVKLMLAQNRVLSDGIPVADIEYIVNEFNLVQVDGELLQSNVAKYFMMHKPKHVVSATKDDIHKTVIDLMDSEISSDLHIVGRLDLNSSGLLLLTNDSRWSGSLMSPEHKVQKHYRVTVKNPITSEYVQLFQSGMFFEYEGITTQPAILKQISEFEADIFLVEGRYHQIKRMFGHFRNQVLSLHRMAIGNIVLDPDLKPGESRALTSQEIKSVV